MLNTQDFKENGENGTIQFCKCVWPITLTQIYSYITGQIAICYVLCTAVLLVLPSVYIHIYLSLSAL